MTADAALHARALAAATSLTRPCTHRPEEPEMTDTDQITTNFGRDLGFVIDSLLDAYRPLGVGIWLASPNRNLDGRRPLDLLAEEGQFERVLWEAEKFAGGPR